MSSQESDRFGVPVELILAVIQAHQGLIRCGCYVPTQAEVAERDPTWVASVLSDWFWESPEELIPSDEQVANALAVLRARPDADHPAIVAVIADAPPPHGS